MSGRKRLRVIDPRRGFEDLYRETGDARYAALAIGHDPDQPPAWALDACRHFLEEYQRLPHRFDDPAKESPAYLERDGALLDRMETLIVEVGMSVRGAAVKALGGKESADTSDVRRLERLWKRETTARLAMPDRSGEDDLPEIRANYRLRGSSSRKLRDRAKP